MAGKVTLNVENFISEIKKMSDRGWNKLRVSDLKLYRFLIYHRMAGNMITSTQIADSHSVNNVALIINLEAKNKIINDQNNEMKVEIHQLKSQVNTSNDHLDNIEQSLIINNIEIVGFPPMEIQNEEEVILEALDDINVTSND